MSFSLQTLAIVIPIALVIAAICLGVIFGATWGYRWITPESNCGQCKYEVPAPMPERCPECGTFYHESTLDTPERRAQRVTGIGRCAISLVVLMVMVWCGVYVLVMHVTRADDRFSYRYMRMLTAQTQPGYGGKATGFTYLYTFKVESEFLGNDAGNVVNGELVCKMLVGEKVYASRAYEIPFRLRAPVGAAGPEEPSEEAIRSLFARAGLDQLADLGLHVQNARDFAYQVGCSPFSMPAPALNINSVAYLGGNGQSRSAAPVFTAVWFGLAIFGVVLISAFFSVLGRVLSIRRRDLTRLVERVRQHDLARASMEPRSDLAHNA